MKAKKITAWILFASMIFTMLPCTGVFAAPANSISLTTASMTRDDSSVQNGTDFLLRDNATMVGEFNPAVDPDDIIYLRRMQDFMIRADSINGQFYGVNGLPLDNALQFTYLDTEGNPLELNNEEGFKFTSTATEQWINIMDETIQHTPYNLEEFWTREDTPANKEKITISRIATADHVITAHVFNAVGDQFAGYIRVKSTDTEGKETIKDYPVIADGKYPSAAITSTTKRHNNGEYNDPLNLPVAENTFISSTDFENEEDYITNEAAGAKISPYVSRRYAACDDDALLKALKNADESVWTMSDVVISSLKIADEEVSSGYKSVKYYIDNIQNLNDIAIETRKAEDETQLRTDIGVVVVKNITDITNDFTNGTYTGSEITIGKENQGMNVLTVVVEDNAGLKKTNKYFFFIDTVNPEADFKLIDLNENVISLFSAADIVTNRQQALDMNASKDVTTAPVTFVSKLRALDSDGNEVVVTNDAKYQYRLLATKVGADEGGNVPAGYTSVVVDKSGNNLGGWKVWAGNTETPIIDKEFDGIVQVRVQDRAGNWSPIVSITSDNKETVITDNTNPVIGVKEYALNANGDAIGNTVDEIKNGTASDILVTSERRTENTDGTIPNEVIHTTTGDVAPWINDSAVLAVNITDKDLLNSIRSSGLDAGQINVKAEFNTENEGKKIKIWNKTGMGDAEVTDTLNLTSDYLFGTDADKDSTFYIEYGGTGVVDITVSVKDQADKKDGDAFSAIYKVQLRVDKINPYITYKGFDITDAAQADLLKPNTLNKDYELRDMPWGPNSQVLEVVVKDDDITSVQSKTNNIKFNADKALDLYKMVDGSLVKIKSYLAGSNNVIALTDCEELVNDKYESNVGYKFYMVYEGTGIAKVEFYADDSAIAPNVRDYPSNQATPVEYDAKLRADKISPEIKNAKLVETTEDVNDGFMLFTVNETNVDMNTRKQMKLSFEITDENTTAEQSGINIQNEKIAGVDLINVYDKYVSTDKTHLYDNEATSYATNDTNDITADPNIDYILLPVKVGGINGGGGTFTNSATVSNADIEALVNTYIDQYAEATNPVTWQKASWKDGAIVVPDEFQGAIVLRTIDRVGNIDYSEPITFVAESRDALIDFEPQNGYIYSQNNYGWSKRDYDYVEIRVKDDNEEKVDSWLENVFISVTDLNGNDISTNDTVKFAHKIHANDAAEETDPSAYSYVSLSDFTNEALYGYDVIDNDGLVEKIARDSEGYIHLGYVRVSESAKINVTIFDKAKDNDADYSGNKTTGTWISRIDRVAPTVNAELVAIPSSEYRPEINNEPVDNNKVVLGLEASITDNESGVAPSITDSKYNEYTPENIPTAGMFATDTSYLYKVTNDADVEIDKFNSGTFNGGQYELPGLQYALIPENGDLEDVMPWNFEANPTDIYDENGYNGELGKSNVWHNYIDDKTPILPEEGFDGYIVIRAIDKAGNITVIGCAPTIDIEAAEGWQKDSQLIQVKASEKEGNITKVEYSGNNNLLAHDEFGNVFKRDITTEAISGEGALVEVTEEGITDVIVTATEEFANIHTDKAKTDSSHIRYADWEGNMVLGNKTVSGYEDYKYQTVQVKIDKTAPTFEFELVDDADEEIAAVSKGFGIKVAEDKEVIDPIPNSPDVAGYRSHKASGISKVEYCVATEGMEEWISVDEADWKVGLIKAYADNTAITGTVKVRVTDNAGNVIEKSKAINIDSATPIISISKSYTTKCSHEPVEVKVTVTPSAEFSDIKDVTYELTGAQTGNGNLTLVGGTISIDKEGTTHVKVVATNKANVQKIEETDVIVHFDLTMPTITGVLSGDWKIGDDNKVVIADSTDKVRYTRNSSEWTELPTDKTIELKPGKNVIRVQAYRDCGCESDVNTYDIWYDNGTPQIDITYNSSWTNSSGILSIIANKGTCQSEIKSITYKKASSVGTDGEEIKYLATNGGNIVFDKDGKWGISSIIIEMESGAKFIYNSEEVFVPYADDVDEFVAPEIIKVDKTAPKITNISLSATTNDLQLFGMEDVTTDKKLSLSVTFNDDTSGFRNIEYATVDNGMQPNWKPLENTIAQGQTSGTVTKANIIDKEFSGSLMIKLTDCAGNECIATRTICADANSPEIAVTAPSDWQTENFIVDVDVVDKGVSSTIKSVTYTINGGTAKELTSIGGPIEITEEGTHTIVITAVDNANNSTSVTKVVKLDKTAPEYSRMISLLGVYNEHDIPESEWNIIHDGWTYNHDVSLDGIKDIYSGIKKVNVKFTSNDGATTETTLNAHQTSSSFSESGKYVLTLIDNAGNVRNINFAIDKTLDNVINVIGVDSVGKLNIAVTDGGEDLSFYKKENSETKFNKMYNGVTEQLIDGKTGVRYIYGQNDLGKKTNTLYVIVAPCTDYGVSLLSLCATPNRYLDFDTEGADIEVKKINAIFNPGINENVAVGSVVEINEDGVYSITTND